MLGTTIAQKPALEITLDHKPERNLFIMRLKGQFDQDSVVSNGFTDAMKELQRLGHGVNVILNLKGAKFGSDGLGTLLAVDKTAREMNCALMLCELSERVKILLKRTQLDNRFQIVPTEEMAEASFPVLIRAGQEIHEAARLET
jgi:anti-anti-sigma factor